MGRLICNVPLTKSTQRWRREVRESTCFFFAAVKYIVIYSHMAYVKCYFLEYYTLERFAAEISAFAFYGSWLMMLLGMVRAELGHQGKMKKRGRERRRKEEGEKRLFRHTF